MIASRKKSELEPLAADGEEHHSDQRKTLAIARTQSVVDRIVQLRLDRPRRFLHPEHHRGQDRGRQQRDQAFEKLLLALGEFAVGADEGEANGEADGDCSAHADPHHGQPLRAAGLLEIARDDADDQRGFDAFAEHDEIGGEHRERWSV